MFLFNSSNNFTHTCVPGSICGWSRPGFPSLAAFSSLFLLSYSKRSARWLMALLLVILMVTALLPFTRTQKNFSIRLAIMKNFPHCLHLPASPLTTVPPCVCLMFSFICPSWICSGVWRAWSISWPMTSTPRMMTQTTWCVRGVVSVPITTAMIVTELIVILIRETDNSWDVTCVMAQVMSGDSDVIKIDSFIQRFQQCLMEGCVVAAAFKLYFQLCSMLWSSVIAMNMLLVIVIKVLTAFMPCSSWHTYIHTS